MIGTATSPILYKTPGGAMLVLKKFEKTAENYPEGIGLMLSREDLEKVKELLEVI